MPARLRKGVSKTVVSANIREIVHDWRRDGTIGASRPATKEQAVKQAVAIALGEARRTARGQAKPPPPPAGTASARKEKAARRRG
jgi:hypothetical protein